MPSATEVKALYKAFLREGSDPFRTCICLSALAT